MTGSGPLEIPAQEPPPLIAYAPPGLDNPADRLLRRAVASVAIVTGGHALLLRTLHVSLARKWVTSPPNMSWSIDTRWSVVLMAATSFVMFGMLLGGVLLLRRSPIAIVLIRSAAAGVILLTVASQVMYLLTNATIASYWSTPASAAFNALALIDALYLPAFMILLTLPPIARRMI